MKKMARKVFRFLSSLKFAVIVILSLAAISAVGTFYESYYNAETAQKIVYYSIWMKLVMGSMVVSLVFSAFSRWPWKKRHIDFLVVHLGVVILIGGSWVTQQFGIDGTVAFEIGETMDYASVNVQDLVVYMSVDGDSFIPFFRKEVDFLKDSPADHPLNFFAGNNSFRINDYIPYAFEKRNVRPSDDSKNGPAVRFQMQNKMVSVTEWVNAGQMPRSFKMGPAKLTLHRKKPLRTEGNEILLWPSKEKDTLNYEVHSAKKDRKVRRGRVKPGEDVETGWMGLVFRVITFYPHAVSESQFTRLERPTQLTTSAIKVEFNEKAQWMGQNDILKFFDDDSVYIVTWGNRKIPLGFNLGLKEFTIGRNPGTDRAGSYQSLVTAPGIEDYLISMNEPLKYQGFTFYQASFQQDDMGKPVASILSVNKDPGRWIKYLGSFLVVLGTIIMFYARGGGRKNKKAA